MPDDDTPIDPKNQPPRNSAGIPDAGDMAPIEKPAVENSPNPWAGKGANLYENSQPYYGQDPSGGSSGGASTQPGDLTRRHDVQEIPVSGWVRVILFFVGIAIMVIGLSIAVPSKSVADPHLVKAILVLSIFGGIAMFWSRHSLRKQLKMVGIWTLLIAGISGYYLVQSNFGDRFMSALDPAVAMVTDEGMVIHKSPDGHFWIRSTINGESVRMMVDTGASNIVLSPADARKVGLDLENLRFTSRAETANGQVKLARARVDSLRIGEALMEDVPVTVNGVNMPGSLFGLSGLQAFSSFEFRGDRLFLRP